MNQLMTRLITIALLAGLWACSNNQLLGQSAQEHAPIQVKIAAFDTFSALAQSGISDPKGVSAGIGAALLATAMGIGVALLSVLAYNVFLAWVEKLNERVKLILLNIPNPLPAPVSEPLAGVASVGAEKA
jgi:hypothetical protein